jgi:hypothetical protein
MRRAYAVVLGLALVIAILGAPREAAAGCFCGCDGCSYTDLNTAKCVYNGGCLCTTGGNGLPCKLTVLAFDGTVSRTEVVAVATKDAILVRKSCNGAVLERRYSAVMAARLRHVTERIDV